MAGAAFSEVNPHPMEGKVVVVTGGNAGVGRACVAALREMGATVVLAARSEEKGRGAVAEVESALGGPVPGATIYQRLDLASFESIEAFAGRLGDRMPGVDVLVNNAGAILDRYETTQEGFEATYGVNHLGHFLLTMQLMPLLRARPQPRVVNVASEAHRAARGIDFRTLQSPDTYRPFPAYARSKLMNILFTRELARRYGDAGLSAFAVHPGVVASRFAQDGDVRGVISWFYRAFAPFLRSPEKGARGAVHLATAPGIEGESGGYFIDHRPRRPSKWGRNDDLARTLWAASEIWVAERAPVPVPVDVDTGAGDR